jgi:hypothetical protein
MTTGGGAVVIGDYSSRLKVLYLKLTLSSKQLDFSL